MGTGQTGNDTTNGPTTLTFTWPERPTLQNRYRRMHWTRQRQVDSEWRQAFWFLGTRDRLASPVETCRITVITEWESRRHLPDAAAAEPSSKAAIDGLVDAGVLAGDGPGCVTSITHRVEVTGRYALTLIVDRVN